jgi:hypothetical protein
VSDPERARVLVRESIAAAGLELLRERFDVVEDADSDLAAIIRLRFIIVRWGRPSAPT